MRAALPLIATVALGCGSGSSSDATAGPSGGVGASAGEAGSAGLGAGGMAPTTGGVGPAAGGTGGATGGAEPATGGTGAALTGGSSSGGAMTGGAAAEGGTAGSTPVDPEPPDPPGSWRSELFPRGWRPLGDGGTATEDGRHLPDFSYAGYHRGERRPPVGEGSIARTVDAALGDGSTDATSGIQSAIDSACDAGGGVVLLPAGTYRVRLPSVDAAAALTIDCSHLVLRGEGPEATRILFDDAARARQKSVIAVKGGGSLWGNSSTTAWRLATDAPAGTMRVSLASAPALSVGEWVVVRADNTEEFRRDHAMDAASVGDGTGFWPLGGSFRGLTYVRRVVAISGAELELDGPIHYPLSTRDDARVYELSGAIEEVGLERFAIGMVQYPGTLSGSEGSHDEDYDTAGTMAYAVHASRAIDLSLVHDSWLYEVDTFEPSENSATHAHVLSNGVQLAQSAFRVHIERCDLGRPQYRGGGGNGYLFHLQGNDALLVDDSTTSARHGFIHNQATSGNVFLRGTIRSSRFSDDSHRFLAHANLYDGMVLEGGWLQSVNRGSTSTGAGFTATAHVFWRTHVVTNHSSAAGCAVESAQWGWGYLIGSQADDGAQAKLCPSSYSNSYWRTLNQGEPVDHVEGEGLGATLSPASLHAAQLALRCARQGIACE